MMKQTVVSIAWLVAVSCLLCSCYHLGTPNHGVVAARRLEVINKTHEPIVAREVTAAVKEHFDTSTGTTLKSNAADAYDVRIVVDNLENKSIARSKLRDRVSRDDKSDAYQTVLFRITLTAHVTVTPVQAGAAPIIDRIYTAYADLPKMHDREQPLQHAIEQSGNSLAEQIVNDIATMKQ